MTRKDDRHRGAPPPRTGEAPSAVPTPSRALAALDDPEMVRVLGPDGKVRPGARFSIDDATLLKVHETMRLVRALDERMIILQRQGRAGFYGACTGEEASVLGSAAALRETDWIVPALRQNSAMLFRGYPLVAYVSQVLGNSGDTCKARQMPSHHAARSVRQVSWSSCIANQLPQAVGIAKAMQLEGAGHACIGYVGDGGTSEGDFHVAMTWAAALKVPLVLACQNNQWAISVPLSRQTRVTRLADKAAAYGIPGVRVDGNDVLAVHQVVSDALARARSGAGTTFVEMLTYRVGAHSTSDDPSRYRDETLTAEWKQLDPVERLETFLAGRGLRSAAQVEEMKRRATANVDAAVREAEALPPVASSSLIEDVYHEPPAALLAQWHRWGGLSRAPQH